MSTRVISSPCSSMFSLSGRSPGIRSNSVKGTRRCPSARSASSAAATPTSPRRCWTPSPAPCASTSSATTCSPLARPSRTQHRATPPQRVRPGLYQVLDSLGGISGLITGRLDILAGNRMARALHTDFEALPNRERNMARYIFLDPATRKLYHDWPTAARSPVAILHVDVGRHPDDPQLAELIGDLSLRDDDFRRWRTDHEVLNTHGTRLYHHPVVGDLTLNFEIFR